MASKSVLCKELEDIVACALCLDKCKDPRSLSCLHTFCLVCLEELVKKSGDKASSFPCPACRHEVQVPEGGVKNFPGAFVWNAVSETVERHKNPMQQSKTYCSVCLERHKQNIAEKFCSNCVKALCSECLNNHDTFTNNHNLMSCENIDFENLSKNNEKAEKCDMHGEELKLYCETCSHLMCMMCAVLDHSSHTKKQISEVVHIHKEQLKNIHGKMFKRLHSYEESLKEVDEALESCTVAENLEAEVVKEHREKIHRQVDKIVEDVLVDIETETDVHRRKLKMIRENLTLEASCLQNSMTHVEAFLKDGNTFQIINTSVKQAETSEKLLSQLVPSKDIPKLNFERSFTDVAELNKESLFGAMQPESQELKIAPPALLRQPKEVNIRKIGQFRVQCEPCGVSCTTEDNIVVCSDKGREGLFVYHANGRRLTELTGCGYSHYASVSCGNDCIFAKSGLGYIWAFVQNGKGKECSFSGVSLNKTGMFVKDNKMFIPSFSEESGDKISYLYIVDLTDYQYNYDFGCSYTPTKQKLDIAISKPHSVAASTNLLAVTSCENTPLKITSNNSLHVFDREGHHKFTYTGEGSCTGGLGWTGGVVIDADNRILVSDLGNNCIHIVSVEGDFVGEIQLDKNNLTTPVGLALNSHGHLVVAVKDSNVVATYQYC